MIFWFFGFPGVGKDFCAQQLSGLIDATYLHIDDFLTVEDREKLKSGSFTGEDRLRKLGRVVDKINQASMKHKDIVAADSLPDHESREFLKENFKDGIVFILVKARASTHQKRITERTGHFFTSDMLAGWINQHWAEPIKIPYIELDTNDKSNLKEDLLKIYQSIKK